MPPGRTSHLFSPDDIPWRTVKAVCIEVSRGTERSVIGALPSQVKYRQRSPMPFDAYSFGSLQIDGVGYDHDLGIDGGKVRKRKNKPSKKFREQYGHTPLSTEEEIAWKCRRLVNRHRRSGTLAGDG